MKFYKVRYLVEPRTVLKYKGEHGGDLLNAVWERVCSVLSGRKLIKCNCKFNEVSIVICGAEDFSKEYVKKVNEDISKSLDVGEIVTQIEDVTAQDVLKNTDIQAEDRDYLLRVMEVDDTPTETEDEEVEESKGEAPEVAIEEENIFETVESLIALDELKQWTREMQSFIKLNISPEKLIKPILSMSYLVSVNEGNGCTTILEVMGKVIARIIGRKSIEVKEIFVEPDKESKTYNVKEILNEVSYVSENSEKLYVFALKVDKFQNNHYLKEWVKLLSGLRNNPKALYVFTLPFIEKDAINDMHVKISDIMPNRVIVLKPFGGEDYKRFCQLYFEKIGMRVSAEALEVIPKLIAEERSDGRFYGIDTVFKICDEILYEKLRGLSESDADATTITESDTRVLLVHDDSDDDGMTGMKKLETLVSLEEVKNRIKEIVTAVKVQKSLKTSGRGAMHMMFSGPPGTGKTIVARILGQILKEEKLLSVGGFYEVTRKDLVGSYVGHTAPKTAEVCQIARGSVLFIDEAYSLNGGSENDYGKEAISTLIAEMENYRHDFVVVFAGYEKDLEKLFELNSGLRDRIPYRVHFPGYNRDELQQIFYKMVNNEGFSYDEGFKEAVSTFFVNLSDDVLNSPNFSNARFVRNLSERVFSKAYLRMQMGDDAIKELMLTASDFNLAITDREFQSVNEKKKHKTIGF